MKINNKILLGCVSLAIISSPQDVVFANSYGDSIDGVSNTIEKLGVSWGIFPVEFPYYSNKESRKKHVGRQNATTILVTKGKTGKVLAYLSNDTNTLIFELVGVKTTVEGLGEIEYDPVKASVPYKQGPFGSIVVEGFGGSNGENFFLISGNLYQADSEPKPESKPVNSTGWKKDKMGWWYRDSKGNYSKNQWKLIEGKWYRFDNKGYMKTGWTRVKNKWYYLNNSGAMQIGWKKISGKWYYMNNSGVMQTRWTKVKNNWYYMNGSGVMQTGWQKSGNKWYFLNSSGQMINKNTTISGKSHIFNKSGVWQGNWEKNRSGWWFNNSNKSFPKNQWKQINNKWYYFNDRGYMQTNWTKVKGKWYYLEGSGEMKIGWLKSGNKWYYLNSTGVMHTGWKKVNKQWYYFYPNGSMARNTVINGHVVDQNGIWYDLDNLDSSIIETEIVKLVNQLRVSLGKNKLNNDSSLSKGAWIRAQEIDKEFSHTRPNGKSYFTVLDGIYKHVTVGENIAYYPAYNREKEIATQIFNGWYNSEGHYQNMINPAFEDIGVGIYIVNNYANAVQLFGTKISY